mmetsp:Transcript_15654/g.37707  ORF Transcript_15654/g.37707 Transcript_15654/m.37707 type:complete len:219 (+) Transcript_15654:141-797(+)
MGWAQPSGISCGCPRRSTGWAAWRNWVACLASFIKLSAAAALLGTSLGSSKASDMEKYAMIASMMASFFLRRPLVDASRSSYFFWKWLAFSFISRRKSVCFFFISASFACSAFCCSCIFLHFSMASWTRSSAWRLSSRRWSCSALYSARVFFPSLISSRASVRCCIISAVDSRTILAASIRGPTLSFSSSRSASCFSFLSFMEFTNDDVFTPWAANFC